MLKDIKVGDLLAVPHANQRWDNAAPNIDYDFWRVERLTKTQAVCGRIRFRLTDGAKVGGGSFFDRVVIATPEMIEKHTEQVKMLNRYRSSKTRLQELDIRKLRTEQLEALADAWEKILAM